LQDFSELPAVWDLSVVMQWQWLNGSKTHYWSTPFSGLNPVMVLRAWPLQQNTDLCVRCLLSVQS